MNKATQQVPEGYRQNARGDLVRIENIKQIDLLRDEVVIKIAEKAQQLQTLIAEY